MPPDKKRRKFVAAVAGLGAGAVLIYATRSLYQGAEPVADAQAPVEPVAPEAALELLLASGAWSTMVGLNYLARPDLAPAEEDVASLQETVLQTLAAEPPTDLETQLKAALMRDFEEGRICDVNGWMLALTECRLGALAFLTLGPEALALEQADPLVRLQEVEIARLNEWGPQRGGRGQPFNEQPNGNSALWFQFDELPKKPYKVFFGAQQMITSVHAQRAAITADLKPVQLAEQTAASGEVPIYLVDWSDSRRQLLGHYVVGEGVDVARKSGHGSANSALDEYQVVAFIGVIDWGPRHTNSGKGFNLQPDGSSAFWLKSGGTHRAEGHYSFVLGEHRLHTTVREKGLTARVPIGVVTEITARPGTIPLYLLDEGKMDRQLIGRFEVRP